jgi:hypothetical protein
MQLIASRPLLQLEHYIKDGDISYLELNGTELLKHADINEAHLPDRIID